LQGYYFARPIPVEELVAWVRQSERAVPA